MDAEREGQRALDSKVGIWGSQVGHGEVVARDDGPLLVDDLVDTKVGVEVSLDVIEDRDGSVRASASVKTDSPTSECHSNE